MELIGQIDITQVLDWQLEQEPCFLESAYTEGGDLAAWAESRGGLAAVPLAERLDIVAQAPFERHGLEPLLAAAWARRANVRLVDALYVALAERLSAVLITLDKGLATAAPRAELLKL